MKKVLLMPVIAMLLLGLSCKKSNDEIEIFKPRPLITEAGEPIGTPVSKSIGVSGGSISS